nr:murein biosynthesis integral membrane protein MurJ [Haloechinothrix halophila]
MQPYQELTRVLPAVGAPTAPGEPTEAPERPAAKESLAKSTGKIAIASLISRITGFLWKIMLVWALGFGVSNDSFNVANTLPNIIYELLLGGVLASIVVPLLVRSQDDPDGGQEYTQRLLTVALSLLAVATVIAVFAAPLFTSVYVDASTDRANPELTTAFAYLLLPQILFYGVFALLMAILNAKQIFGPPAWAPVVNNLVVMATIGVFALVPGEISIDPVRMGDAKLLTLGIGVSLGIVAQAVMLIPPMLRTGFRFKWNFGLDSRMKEFGGLAAWILGYVAVSQIGYIVTTRVLTAGDQGGMTAYYNAWLLFQLPYGVIGVSLLTAIMPRMSRAAADGDHPKLISNLSYASRISTVTLLPIAAVMTVVGSSIGVALFSYGESDVASAGRLGESLAIAAFGLLPYALVMLQLRVFYALKDARTPTLIMLVMTAVKVPLLYLSAALLDPKQVVLGAMMVNSLTFVVGAVLGQVWLWVRLGNLRSRRVLGVILFTVFASGLGVAAAVVTGMLVPDALPSTLHAWVSLIAQSIVGLGVSFGILAALKVDELAPLTNRVSRLLGRA